MKSIVLVLIVSICCTLGGSTLEAAPDPKSIILAKSYYEKGRVAHYVGKFDEAVTWYIKAYEAWPNPDFLYNIAQSYWLADKCKEARSAYERYLSAKLEDKDAPLGKEEQTEIERLIKEAADCADTHRNDASAQKPSPAASNPTANNATINPTANNATANLTDNSAVTNDNGKTTINSNNANDGRGTGRPDRKPRVAVSPEPADNDVEVSASTTPNAKQFLAYAASGISIFSGRGDSQPWHLSSAVGIGYPLFVGLFTIDVGVRVSYSPIANPADGSSKSWPSLVGILPAMRTTYRVSDKLGVCGDIGMGVAMLLRLSHSNPLTAGSILPVTMPSLRGGVAVEYAVTPRLVATVASLGFVVSRMNYDSLTQFDMLAGLGYRM